MLAVGLVRAVRARSGSARPTSASGLTSLWYGVRGQGSTVASNVTARLDVAMLPAFVSAASVGLYSVATNVSLIVYQLSNTFAGLVLPAAASDPERGPIKVVGSLWASLVDRRRCWRCVLALLARPLLGLVYGDDFRDAAEPLLLLLPGAVLFAGASILAAGVYAAGRPFTATVAQLLGMVVTVDRPVRVPAHRRDHRRRAGLDGVSTRPSSWRALVAYKTVTGTPWRYFVPTPARLRELTALTRVAQ